MPNLKENRYQDERTQKLIELTNQWRAEGEAKSAYKRGQRVRVCQDLSFSFNQNPACQDDILVPTNPHDCNDPAQHFESRVVGWDSFGRIQVAMRTRGDNPHCAEWCWSDDSLSPYSEGEDWTDLSSYKMGTEVIFVWEYDGFPEKVGKTFKAKLISPHIEEGDWFVSYQAYPETDGWITCVVNESQMTRTAPVNA